MSHSLRVTLSAPDYGNPAAASLESAAQAPLPPALVGEKMANGLAQLVLTLIKLLHELMQRQALRRVEAGELNDDEVERVGRTLMQQATEIERLCELLGLRTEDLNLDLGPLGRLFD